MSRHRETILIFSYVYPPDPAAVGQHMHDAAAELAHRGRRVRVVTSNRGYDDPTTVLPRREIRDGVEVVRVPLSSFGKKRFALRILAMASFALSCVWQGLTTRGLGCIIVSTSPPTSPFSAVVAAGLRGVPIKFWVMDLNPDQAILRGLLRETSLIARAANSFNRLVLRRAADVVALDRFMVERLQRKVRSSPRLHIIPPWPLDEHLAPVPHDRNPFRKAHGVEGKFVVMYSGNHGLTTPITTILGAALELHRRDDIVFMFIGAGHGKEEVERAIREQNAPNIRSLPYQPLDQIRYSLSAADLHVVTMSDEMSGIIHPCKIYGAMRIARPILFIGPEPCYATDLIAEGACGWRTAQGDARGAARLIETIAATPATVLAAMGQRGAQLVDQKYSMAILRKAFCDMVERGLPVAERTVSAGAAAQAR
jgi:colanic acid biosynthesis glycosyl transferase WcaI